MGETSVEPAVMLMNIPSAGNRSVSPLSPTPSPLRQLRGVRLFRAISRKLGRRSVDDLSYTYAGEEDSRSSSTDSCSSTSAGARCSRPAKKPPTEGSSCSSGGSGFRSASPNHISSSGSESGSEHGARRRHHHSTTGSSFRKVFQHLTLNTRSHSCSSESSKQQRSAKNTTPKRILRPPQTYTYVRGLSGLPTQRVPRTPPRSHLIQNGCGPYIPGLNR